ncbi:arsenate reductase family protein [Treponema sp.]
MKLQIFGTKKCQTTRKAERYFRDRDIDYQFIDLELKGISPGELKTVIKAVGKDRIIDTASKGYIDRGLKYMDFDIEREILSDPLLLRTPIVRDGNDASAGEALASWAEFAAMAKGT